jgi:hypothetical protein
MILVGRESKTWCQTRSRKCVGQTGAVVIHEIVGLAWLR